MPNQTVQPAALWPSRPQLLASWLTMSNPRSASDDRRMREVAADFAGEPG